MSFLVRHLPRQPLWHTRIFKRNNTTNTHPLNPTTVPPVFTQKPPIWVRFAWPIIIANALLMGSAVDITWSHWATLVKDLEAIAEKNSSDSSTPNSTAKSNSAPDATAQNVNTEKKEETYHWERRPTWQRAVFCGIYATGWALSTAYFLKYRQTFVTSLRFFRAPKEITHTPTPAPIPAASTTTGTTAKSVAPSPTTKSNLLRLVHISTASNPKGLTLPLNELNIQDGRNETEMVIRTKGTPDRRGKRTYWYLSLTDAIVEGGQYSTGGARDRLLAAWNGSSGGVERIQRVSGWRSGPAMRS